MKKLSTALFTVVMVVSLLTGCGGGGGGGSTPASTNNNTVGGSYSISGKVAEASGAGMAGVTMSLTGSSSITITSDNSGNYSFINLANGTYTLTPTKTGYTCSPESKTITVNNADITGQDFVGSDAGGNGIDTTAPSVPTGLVATVISSSQINLTWAASTDSVGVAGYEIWRGSTKVTTVTTMSYDDTGLAASTSYTYSVKSFDAAGNISASSAIATATTLAVGAGGSVAGQNWSIKVSKQMNLASNCQWSSTPPPVWSGTNTMQRGYGIAWSGAKFVAVGDAGSILTSTDGISWTMRSAGSKTLRSVVWSGSLFVAVGDAGTIITSADGSTWTSRTSGTTNILNAIAASSSKFVAVGNSGTILTSSDGITWAASSSGTTDPLYGIVWSGSQFVAVGYKAATTLSFASGVILASPNGINWTSQVSGTDQALYSIARSGTSFVAVGASGIILTSNNGTTWVSQTSTNTLTLYSVIWAGTQFVAVGGSTDGSFDIPGLFNTPAIVTSPDGITWSKINSSGYFIRGVVWSGTMLAAVGNGYITTASSPAVVIFTSSTGATWTPRVTVDFKLKSISGSNSLLVAVGTNAILSSSDGNIWNINAAGTGLNAIAWAGSKFVAVGDGGAIKTSTDGITWTTQTSGTTANLNGITWTGTKSIVVGAGVILTSTDNILWSVQSFSTWPNSACNFTGVAWSGTQFAVVGYYWDSSPGGGNRVVILSSLDGVTWTARVPNNLGTMTAVVWGNNKFVVTGANNPYSADGISWTAATGGGGNSVSWSGSEFVAVGSGGQILTSTNGLTWTNLYLFDAFGSLFENQCQYGNQIIGGSMLTGISYTGITWFGAKYVAIASPGNYIVTSP